jgi:pimeloyl-ACP methyl ester carboxylesterase
VKTLPTASIRRRAGRLLETVSETAADDGPIHLIGHSTGGLDARLFTTPGANLIVDESYDLELEPWARRVESVVTLSSPHFGTPMATVFSSLLGSQLLYLLSLGTIYTLQFGKLPLSLLIAVGGIVTRLDDSVGLENTVLDQWYEQLLDNFDLDRETAVKLFLDEIREDQSLVGQLTPGGIDLFNASTSNRGGVRYGSVVTMAREPSLATIKEFGFDPYRQASHGVFRALAFLTGGGTYESLSAEDEAFFTAHYETVPDRGATDGIVPTRSQVWGELIHAARGDHLDTVGHFDDPSHVPPHIDWLASGSKFRRPAFEALWSDVATFIAEATSMSSPRRSE